jgi:hypothetical protein
MTLKVGLGPVTTFAAAMGVAALVGCGGSNETATEEAKPAATKGQSAKVPDQLVGVWTRRVAGRTRRGRACGLRRPSPTAVTGPGAKCKSASGWVPPGVLSMKVRRDGNVEMWEAGTDPAGECLTEFYCWAMVMSARNGKLIIGKAGPCTGPATYSYKITADKLTTERVKDSCRERRPFLFDGATWRRQS